MSNGRDPQLAVLTARESLDDLLGTLLAARHALGPAGMIDVLVNGNAELARGLCAHLESRSDAAFQPLQVWQIDFPDKSFAWNEYLHRIWSGVGTAFFVDGYARLRPDVVQRLQSALQLRPDLLAATGVPSAGPSARAVTRMLLRDGGLHGNCYALSAGCMRGLREAGFHLPLGIYRTDSTLGAALSFGMDPSRQEWDPFRHIHVDAGASWELPQRRWWRWSEWRTVLNRRLRQEQGRMENRAVEWFFRHQRCPIGSLPRKVDELLLHWSAAQPQGMRALARFNPLHRPALRQALAPRDWTLADRPAGLLLSRTARPS